MPVSAFAERGQAVPLFLLFVVVALLGLSVLARLGTAVDDAARARTAADAAALAGAVDGWDAAEQLARANGGHLDRYRRRGVTVTVTVTVGRARATARAEASAVWGVTHRDPPPPGRGPDLSE